MTEDEVIQRTVAIIGQLYDLKEDVLYGGGIQPAFDAGILEGAIAILNANVDDDDPRVKAEIERQCGARLARVLAMPRTTP